MTTRRPSRRVLISFLVFASLVAGLILTGSALASDQFGLGWLSSVSEYVGLAATSSPTGTSAPKLAKNELLSAAYQPLKSPLAPQSAFTPGNLVVYRVGDGTAALSNASTAGFLDEYTTSGTYVQTIALPTTAASSGNRALTVAGSSTSEGVLLRSTDGQYLSVAGYNIAPGTTSVATTTNNGIAGDVNRVVGRIDKNGTIDSTTALIGTAAAPLYSGVSFRAAVLTGTSVYHAGANGAPNLGFSTFGGNTATSIATGTERVVGVYGGDLYYDTQTTLNKFTGLPTSTTAPTQLLGSTAGQAPATASGFVFLDIGNTGSVNTCYLADGTSLKKFTISGTTMTARGTATITGTSSSLSGLTASVSGTNVTVFISSPAKIETITDSSGAAGTLSGTATALTLTGGPVTIGANAAFRGLAFSPEVLSVTSTSPVDSATNVATNSNVAVTFNTAVNASTITVQGSTGACSGSLQVSSDGFSTCIGLTSLTPSGGNTTFTATPASALASGTNYKIRVTTAATTATGTPLASQFTQATGFTTVSTNADLASITPSVGTLSPPFAANTLNYTINVSSGTTSINIAATSADSNASVSVNGNVYFPGGNNSTVSLSPGSNVIPIDCKAQDGTTIKSYSVNVVRAALSTNADLASITPSVGTLSPSFAANTLSYTVNVSSGTTSINIAATSADSNASVSVNGNVYFAGGNNSTVSLNPGSNVVPIDCKAQDGTTIKSYSVNVVRAFPAPTVTTVAASPVGSTTATLNGTGNPAGQSTTAWFRYSPTNPGTCDDAFGTRAPASGGSPLGTGSSAVAYNQAITGLTGATTYFYSAIASNAGGTGFGSVMQFTTQGTTSLAVVTSGSPSTLGASVTFTASVSVVTGSGTLTGTVAFVDSVTSAAIPGCSAKTLTANQATCTTSSLAQGSHTITATYGSDPIFAGSSNTVGQTVQGTTSLALVTSGSPSTLGASVTFTASVSVVTGSGTLTGTVAFVDSVTAVAIPGCSAKTLTANQATCTTSSLAQGSHTITATYGSDPIFAGSSNTVVQVVNASASPTINVSTNGPLNFGTVTVGNTSAVQSYTVSGANLTANLVVTPPADFQVSTLPNSGFGSSVTLTPSSGTVSTTTIYVRYVPSAAGGASGNISNASTGATTQNVAVVGGSIVASCATAPPNMLAWYKGENNPLDSRGGYNGTFQGSAAYGGGKVNQGFSFNGSSFVTVPAGPSGGALNMAGNAVTIDGWINPSVISGDAVYFGKTNTGGNDFLVLREFNELLGIVKIGGTEHFVVPSPAGFDLPANTWTHVALTYDGTNAQMYVNGVASGSPSTFAGGIDNDASPFDIGGRSGSLFFNGKIDEVEAFNRTLTPTEISNIYNASTAGKCTDVGAGSGLAGWWPGDGDARDISGNLLNGALTNGVGFGLGKVSQAFSLNGANQYVLIGDPIPAPLQIQNEISFDAWIYVTGLPPGPDGLGMIMGSQRDGTTSGASIFYDGRPNPDGTSGVPPGHIHFQIGDGSSFHATNSQSVVPLNQWVHIVATRKAGEDGKIYYNGVLQPETSVAWNGAVSYNSVWFAIGQQKDLNRPFSGLIDEPAVFNRALTASEVQSEFNAGLAGRYKSVTTATGANVSSNAGGDATVTFTNVTTGGTTQQIPIDITQYPALPGGQTSIGLTYDISTAASYTGNTKVCFNLPLLITGSSMANLHIDHLEGGVWVDRTGTKNVVTKIACTSPLGSLSPFALVAGVPTAAGVSISGRVLTSDGAGLRNARVTITDQGGVIRSVLTNAFGNYSFDGVASGQSYLVGVQSRKYTYTPRVVLVSDTLADVDFMPQ